VQVIYFEICLEHSGLDVVDKPNQGAVDMHSAEEDIHTDAVEEHTLDGAVGHNLDVVADHSQDVVVMHNQVVAHSGLKDSQVVDSLPGAADSLEQQRLPQRHIQGRLKVPFHSP